MADFSIDVSGLGKILENLSKDHTKKAVNLAVGSAALKLNEELNFAVKSRFTYNKTLDSVRIGKSTSTAKVGKNFSESRLKYRYKSAPLVNFDFKLDRVSRDVKYLFRSPTTGKIVRVINKGYATAINIKVRRNRGFKRSKGFFQKANSRNRRRGIYKRLQARTWENALFVRAPIRPLFGPSLTVMAEEVLNKDKKVQDLVETFPDLIYKNLKL